MKKLCISLFLFSCMVVAENLTEQNPQKASYNINHSDFETFFGQSPTENLKWHMNQYGRYVNQELSTFEKEELALLFGQIKRDYDTKLDPEVSHSWFHDIPWTRIFKNVEKVKRSLNNAGIPKSKDEVYQDVKAMFEKFRNESCTKEKIEPFDLATVTHKCLYAQMIKEHVDFSAKLAEEYGKELDKEVDKELEPKIILYIKAQQNI